MKPAPFDYYAPTTLEQALDQLAQLGYSAKVLAGGQSLVASMNFRISTPAALLDLTRIPELVYIRPAPDGGVAIGAMTTDSDVEHSPLVKERAPLLVEAMPFVAHPQIRNRGTFGGNLAHGDPTAQLPAVAIAVKARIQARSKTATRWINAEDFYVTLFTTVLQPDELLVETVIPPLPPRSGCSYEQMARQAGAQALVGAAAVVTLDDRNRCKESRLVFVSVGETPTWARKASQMLLGQAATPELIKAVAQTASQKDIDPGGDIHCSPEFRRHLAEVMAQRALTKAFNRAAGKEG